MCWSWLVKCKRFLVKATGVSQHLHAAGAYRSLMSTKIVDNLSRIASIGYNAIPLVTKETEAHFGNADEHVAVLDSPDLNSTKLSNVVLLKAKDAQAFKDHGHICTATGSIRVSTSHSSWLMAVTGRMRANVAFKDKHCWKKRIYTVAKDYEDIEFWILGEGAETFPHALFVTREFTMKHGLHEPVPRTFVLSRKGLRRSVPELSDRKYSSGLRSYRWKIADDQYRCHDP
ncbi:hypothetical protein DIS24_g11120 [Lasiodiplodia hormozganensis]|uniref:Uncharacterized protein n=1 Tax=Lasiodiplodia hormozganensis TaxID=869390 RepID=A0AA40C5A1_9PEZI|nr:hypothetical protein DIS24_g11120 [Lasiodiplodia hormozganensis]